MQEVELSYKNGVCECEGIRLYKTGIGKTKIQHSDGGWFETIKEGVPDMELLSCLLGCLRIEDREEADWLEILLETDYDKFIVDPTVEQYSQPGEAEITPCLPLNAGEHLAEIASINKYFQHEETTADIYNYYCPEGTDYKFRRQAAESFPFFFKYFADQSNGEVRELIDQGLPLNDYFKKSFNLTKIQLNRMRKYKYLVPNQFSEFENTDINTRYYAPVTYSFEEIAKQLGRIEPTWCPNGQEEWDAFMTMNILVFERLHRTLGIDWNKLISTTSGQWTASRDKFIKSIGCKPDEVDMHTYHYTMSGILEFLEDFSRNVMIPVLPAETLNSFSRTDSLHRLMGIAARMFIYGKSNPIPQLIKYYLYWLNIKPKLEDAKTKTAIICWPPLIGKEKVTLVDKETDSKIVFRNILDRPSLSKEGKEMQHCVGSYTADCVSGRTHIFSILDKKTEQRATLEMRTVLNTDGSFNSFSQGQLRGKRNSLVTPTIVKVVGDFKDRVTKKADIPKLLEWIQDHKHTYLADTRRLERINDYKFEDFIQVMPSKRKTITDLWCSNIIKGFKPEMLNKNPEFNQFLQESR